MFRIVDTALVSDYETVKNIISNMEPSMIKNLLVPASIRGIPRDVELISEYIKFFGFNSELDTALIAAITYRHYYVVLTLIDAGANINTNNSSPIKTAVSKNDDRIVELLVSKGVEINIKNDCLVFYLKEDNSKILDLLIKSGLDVTTNYHKVYDYLLRNKFTNCATLLVNTDIKISKPNKEYFLTDEEMFGSEPTVTDSDSENLTDTGSDSNRSESDQTESDQSKSGSSESISEPENRSRLLQSQYIDRNGSLSMSDHNE